MITKKLLQRYFVPPRTEKSGLPDFSFFHFARFVLLQHTNAGKNILPNTTKYTKGHTVYQMAIQYTKWPYSIPNGRKIFQMAINYANFWFANIPSGNPGQKCFFL
jgi:hypothetical protein